MSLRSLAVVWKERSICSDFTSDVIILFSLWQLEKVFSRHLQTEAKESEKNSTTEESNKQKKEGEEREQRTYEILHKASSTPTTLLLHLFGRDGQDLINYEQFARFMLNLQTEVLELEFHEFSRGLDKISELDFAKIMLRYARLNPDR